jgi:drug/metabolite transporter (DMT)-like permease
MRTTEREPMPEQTILTKPASLASRAFNNPFLMLALAGLLWSGNHIAGRAAAGHVPPVSLASLRWLLAAALLWPFVSQHVRADWPQIAKGWRRILALSLLGGATFSSLQFIALQHTSALNASIFNSFAPAVIVAGGALFFKERLGPLNLVGVALSFVGVMVIVSRADYETFAAFTFNKGDVILLANMGIWAIYSVFLRIRPAIHQMSFTFMLAVISGLSLIPFGVIEHVNGFTFKFDWLTLAVLAYVTVFSGALAYVFWNRGMENLGAARGGAFLHLIPFYGAVLATTLLGESLQFFHVAGCALILTGVWFAARR